MKVIIVGGVAGGASCAARLRRIDENCEIIMLEKGEHVSYASCGLPYYIGETIKEKEKLTVTTPKLFKERFNIDVRTFNEAVNINRKEKYVEIINRKTNEKYIESYDKLVLSPGAVPVKPDIPGIGTEGIFTIRNIPDTYKIKEYIEKNSIKSAAVIGGGFVGIEMAENLKEIGLNVSIIELAPHVIGSIDFDMAQIIHDNLVKNGINLFLEKGASSFKRNEEGIEIKLSDGTVINAGITIISIGVAPDVRLAEKAGLKTGNSKAIEVDEFLRTSDPDIYAVGDAVEVQDFITKDKIKIPLAGPANKQGRIAADNIAGRNEKYKGTQGTLVLKVFNTTCASTGINEETLIKRNIKYKKSYTFSGSHAGYYPGASVMAIKLIFSPDDGKVLGSQIIGEDGVDKRIDVIAAAIRAKMTVFDLEELELAYAPPYSSAKDPVNMAGYVASNILKNDHKVFYWHDVKDIDSKNAFIVDVSTPTEYMLGTIENAVNIPVDEIRDRINEFPEDKKIYLFCQVGLRGYVAYRILVQNGYRDVVNLSGGYKMYKIAGRRFNANGNSQAIKTNGRDNTGKTENSIETVSIDACGLQCPGPIIKLKENIEGIDEGKAVKVTATDPGFVEDADNWSKIMGHTVIESGVDKGIYFAVIKKGRPDNTKEKKINGHDKTMVVFSNDLDKAIASFIIANGAVAMGRNVTMFFTFWGLNILRKSTKVKIRKNMIEKMFGIMMPKGSSRLKLSKMNMAGIGSKMIRGIMKKKNVYSLETMIDMALKNGVRLVACSMSMDIMGIKKDELIKGVEIGGVASYLAAGENADMNLFI